jgi:glycosyltransferase involved in cell wall biosynthesis
MIVIVAPYSPFDRSAQPNLGAARKIEAVIGILCGLDPDVVLINTAHNSEFRQGPTSERTQVAGRQIAEITPPTYVNRKLGKLLNLFEARSIVDLVMLRGTPRLVWLYNGYAMESLLAGEFRRRGASCAILELEDAHFARGRGFNPKPLVDWLAFRRSIRRIDHVFAVNEALRGYAAQHVGSTSLFPGIIQEGLIDACDQRAPFPPHSDVVHVGYFGGLTREKGADRVLALAGKLDPGFKMHVCGSGEMSNMFCKAQADLGPDRLAYHGLVDDEQLNQLIAACDVLLNLHSPIQAMGDGVFPFKVLESVASGRLLVSTRVPSKGLDEMLQGAVFVGDSEEHQLEAVRNARATYTSRIAAVESGKALTRRSFSTRAFAEQVQAIVATSSNKRSTWPQEPA